MKSLLQMGMVIGAAAAYAPASTLKITVRDVVTMSQSIEVPNNAIVEYELIGELDDALNGGLALWGADLTLECNSVNVPLDPGVTPVAPPMDNFVSSPTNKKGVSNPAGYGGTQKDGKLLQAGGAQNSIKNDPAISGAPFPDGTVIINVAHPEQEVVLLRGSFRTSAAGDFACFLRVTNGFANVIKHLDSGTPFYRTEAAGVMSEPPLSVRRVPEGVSLVSSSPACDSTLWRTQRNAIELTFSGAIPAFAQGQVKIVEILANGVEGEVVTNSFARDPNAAIPTNVLRLVQQGLTGRPPENPAGVIKHRRWYSVQQANWDGVDPFKRTFLVQIGDSDNNRTVNSLDVSAVNGFGTCFNVTLNCPEKARGDVNGDNNINSLDVSSINGIGTSFAVGKPSLHDCLP